MAALPLCVSGFTGAGASRVAAFGALGVSLVLPVTVGPCSAEKQEEVKGREHTDALMEDLICPIETPPEICLWLRKGIGDSRWRQTVGCISRDRVWKEESILRSNTQR